MARTARLHYPGGVFHLISRFARDEWWFDRASARAEYLRLLGQTLERTDAELLAYCLMSNHSHLVVVQGQDPLERLTKAVNTGFAAWASRSRRRRRGALGPVFAERPRMILVESDPYLLELVRYVHNNPVRAKVVRQARNSDWSSHQAYVGRVSAPPWLRAGYVLERFGKRADSARTKFNEFVDDGVKESRRPEFSGGVDGASARAVRAAVGTGHRLSDGVLGSDTFVKRVRSDTERVQATLSTRGATLRLGQRGRPSIDVVLAAVLSFLDVDEHEFVERPRARACAHAKRLLTWMWIREYEGKQIEVARLLGVSTAAVSQYYNEAVRAAASFEGDGSAVAVVLGKEEARGARRRTGRPVRRPHAVRYHVDVDERLQ